MKRTLSIILCILMLLGLTLLPASADGEKIATFSEDFSTLYAEGETYLRYDTSRLTMEYWDESSSYEAKLTGNHPDIKEIYVERYSTKIEFWVEITYKNGSVLSCNYIQEDLIPLYEQLLTATDTKVEIDFEWPDGNQVSTVFSSLMVEPLKEMDQDTLEWCDYFEVYSYSADQELQVSRGQLYSTEDGFYYMDYTENNISSPFIYPGDYKSLSVHLITNQDLLAELEAAEKSYMGIGLPFGESLTKVIGICLLVLLFGLLPMGLAILGLIMMLRSKKPVYKKLGASLLIPSGATLLIFITLALIFLI